MIRKKQLTEQKIICFDMLLIMRSNSYLPLYRKVGDILREYKKIILIITGALILSFGYYNIHSQCHITEGGILGLELLLQHWFHISPAITSAVLDISCYILGIIILDRSFFRYAIIATGTYAISYHIFEQYPPLLPNLSNYPLLASIAGAMFVGFGCGIVVRIGGACGGDDALAMVLNKVTRIPISFCYLASDITVLLLSLTYIPYDHILYSLITVTISSWLVGVVQNGSFFHKTD